MALLFFVPLPVILRNAVTKNPDDASDTTAAESF